jgi:hypothetical protein
MERFQRGGLTRAIGVSNFHTDRLIDLADHNRRLYVKLHLAGRRLRRTMKSCLDETTVSLILEEAFVGDPFSGHDRINHTLLQDCDSSSPSIFTALRDVVRSDTTPRSGAASTGRLTCRTAFAPRKLAAPT